MRRTFGCTKWKVALHQMCCLTFFKAITLQKCSVQMWNSYSCNSFNNLQQGCFVTIALLKYILFSWSVQCCFQSLTNLFPGGGEFDLKIFPRGWGFWYDLIRAFVKSPYVSRVWGGGGFNWLVHYDQICSLRLFYHQILLITIVRFEINFKKQKKMPIVTVPI